MAAFHKGDKAWIYFPDPGRVIKVVLTSDAYHIGAGVMVFDVERTAAVAAGRTARLTNTAYFKHFIPGVT